MNRKSVLRNGLYEFNLPMRSVLRNGLYGLIAGIFSVPEIG